MNNEEDKKMTDTGVQKEVNVFLHLGQALVNFITALLKMLHWCRTIIAFPVEAGLLLAALTMSAALILHLIDVQLRSEIKDPMTRRVMFDMAIAIVACLHIWILFSKRAGRWLLTSNWSSKQWLANHLAPYFKTLVVFPLIVGGLVRIEAHRPIETHLKISFSQEWSSFRNPPLMTTVSVEDIDEEPTEVMIEAAYRRLDTADRKTLNQTFDRINRYAQLFELAECRTGIDRNLLMAMAARESFGNPNAVSRAGAQGLMGIMPYNAGWVTNLKDPHDNIIRGAEIFQELLDKYAGDILKALAAYNAGTDRVRTAVKVASMFDSNGFWNGIHPFLIREPREYVVEVLLRKRALKEWAKHGTTRSFEERYPARTPKKVTSPTPNRGPAPRQEASERASAESDRLAAAR